ncbi:NUDIX domain-containing protein [Pseudodesulfovibrio sp. JC047]|uniref:(deoxy)nucleoside triphosphate pyrophosphohydrolase n=1 Tax=Pseudodesulfovibrio sp. JC047 TaxID=2683199 RepID=UPI0013D71F6E|nr:(deoxy)nucleoside triphosphate pyrophosphohydrolase [Pseudodesulfovibrio sp. JC047]NDV20038.1 NUDIX domain-containing protein [Pseudodesulfovibrio sp. JC047]
MKPHLEVVAGILWHDGNYLAVQRPEGAPMAGWWEFPGGKVEQDESRDTALVREFQEELALTPTDFTYWQEREHEYEAFVVHIHFYHIHHYSGELTMVENQQFQWVDPCQSASLDFLPADVGIVESLHSHHHES